MSQIHLIDELLGAAGIHFRKEKRSNFFPLLIDGMERLDAVALTYYEYPSLREVSMYGADETGNIRYLMCHAMNLVAARIIQQMERLELLWLRDNVLLDGDEIVALSALPHLRYLMLSLKKNVSLVLSHIGRMKQLQVLMIENTVDPVDLSLLKYLPALRSLFIWNGEVQNPHTLEEITSLRNLWLDEIEDPADISRLCQLETLGINSKLKTGYGVLAGLSNLRFLQLDETIPIGFLHQFPKLQGLAIPYDHPTLSPLLDFPQLDTLFLMNAKIEDVSALHAFKNLSFLDMASCQIRDGRSLAGQQTIAYLNLNSSHIELFPESLAMPQLRHLIMEGNSTSKLANATFLGSCTNLGDIKAQGECSGRYQLFIQVRKVANTGSCEESNQRYIRDGGPFRTQRSGCAEQSIEHLAPLQNHIALQSLVVSITPFEMPVLAGLHQLEHLALSGTKLKDLSFIKRLRNLFA